MKDQPIRVSRLIGNIFEIVVGDERERICVTKSEAKKLLAILMAFKSAGAL